MEIESLYIYPIKSMRGISLPTATLTPHGFPHDRRFMVLQPTTDPETGQPTFKNISIAPNNELVRFWQAIDQDTNILTVTYRPADGGEATEIAVPLEPATEGLEVIEVVMHKSPTPAYRMPTKYSDWLTKCLGYEAILAYIGSHRREVRMSSLGWKPSPADPSPSGTNNATSWLNTLTTAATSLLPTTTTTTTAPKPSEIGFADVAPYLITSSKSMDSIRSRLPSPESESYDIIKFRPNIVVRGAPAVWEEDHWAQLTLPRTQLDGSADAVTLECEHNCARCRSINIDYDTGAQGTGEAGTMLKKLMKDRRVDAGAKWSPVFGRYAFLRGEFDGAVVGVGDEVVVSRWNEGDTAFDWKGLSTLPGGGRD